MTQMIPEIFETTRLIIKNATLNDCNELQRIGEGWEDKTLLEGEPFEHGYIENCLIKGDLPPIANASKLKYRLKSFTLKEEGTLIGFTDIYHGYPSEDTVWISLFVLDKPFQNNGFASEIMESIENECRNCGYSKIGIGVYLKNWQALRFWTRMGFDKITGISGDKVYSEKTFALIKLEKNTSKHHR